MIEFVPTSDRYVEEIGVLSPSQIDTFRDCERKWAFEKIDKVRRTEIGGSAALGTAIHSQLEAHLKGRDMDFTIKGHVADIASTGLVHLPPSTTPGLEVERAFKFRSDKTGISYRGFIDLAIGPEHRGGIPLIHDHKSTSNIAAWAKSPEVLRTDPQAVIYSEAAILRWPEAPAVDLQWLYMQTRGPRVSKLVTVQLSKEHIRSEFAKIEVDSQRIVTTLNRTKRALDLPPAPSSCKKYGGCPYQHLCNLSPLEVLNSTMTEAKDQNMNVPLASFSLDFLPPPPPMVLTDRDVPGVTEIPAIFANPFPATDQPVNPPEGQAPPPSGEDAVKAEEAKPKRGRKPGTKNKPKSEGVDTTVDDAVPAAVQSKGFTLYVDCTPMASTGFVLVEDYVAQANREIVQVTGSLEWRLGEAVAYGKGAGMLSSRVAELAVQGNVDVVLDSRTPEGGACKAALVAAAQSVVMGFR